MKPKFLRLISWGWLGFATIVIPVKLHVNAVISPRDVSIRFKMPFFFSWRLGIPGFAPASSIKTEGQLLEQGGPTRQAQTRLANA